jgi:hypothetical protein
VGVGRSGKAPEVKDAETDRTECLGQIELNPALTREERERLDSGDVAWETCAGGCCLQVTRAPGREVAGQALQLVVDLLVDSGHRCSGVLVVRRGDGELFTLRVSRGRAYVRLLDPARTAEPRLASVTPLRNRRDDQRAWL